MPEGGLKLAEACLAPAWLCEGALDCGVEGTAGAAGAALDGASEAAGLEAVGWEGADKPDPEPEFEFEVEP